MRRLLQKPAVRDALQAGAGVGLAMALGHLVSGQRWYWAVIAAFIVGAGVQSRGEALVKGLQRAAGTFAGIGAGIALATAVSGHTDLAMVLVLICISVAYYSFQGAYGVMIFFITIMLALLYGMLGQFRPQLLVLRLEETAVGVSAGILATALLLPVRENEVFCDAAVAFLEALRDLLTKVGANDADAIHHATARLVSSLQALRQSIGAIKRGWVPLAAREYRGALRPALRCAYWAREIGESRVSRPEELAPAMARIEQIRARLDQDSESGTAGGAERAKEGELSEEVRGLLDALDRFDGSLARVGFGVRRRERTKPEGDEAKPLGGKSRACSGAGVRRGDRSERSTGRQRS